MMPLRENRNFVTELNGVSIARFKITERSHLNLLGIKYRRVNECEKYDTLPPMKSRIE